MTNTPAFPLQVYFDGSCSVCAAEMASYRQQEHGGRLIFVDISNPEFDPAPHGITMDAFMYELHAIDRAGHVYRGVEAFRAIWLAFPASTRYGLFGTLASLPGVSLLAKLAYWSFARARKYLPASSEACKNGSCRIGQHPPQQ